MYLWFVIKKRKTKMWFKNLIGPENVIGPRLKNTQIYKKTLILGKPFPLFFNLPFEGADTNYIKDKASTAQFDTNTRHGR